MSFQVVNSTMASSAGGIAQRPAERIKDIKTLDGRLTFSVSHEDMVVGWKPTDYELGVFKKGICTSCCTNTFKVQKQANILSQIGAYRFGLNVGFCLPCVNRLARINPNLLNIKMGFKDSNDIHEVNLTVDRLNELKLKRTITLEKETKIEGEISEKLDSILKVCVPLLKQSELEKTKPYLCKTCNKIIAKDEENKSEVQLVNNFRELNIVAALCTACFKLCILDRGCSMVSCPKCVNKTKFCIVCMNDVVGKHDLIKCTTKAQQILSKSEFAVPLESIQICECPDNEAF